MTTTEGVSIWFRASGLTVHFGEGHRAEARVMTKHSRLVVTPEVRQANTGRDGKCVFDLVDDLAAQERRFGKVMFEIGEPPTADPLDALEVDSFEWDQARANALKEAGEIADPDAQRIALAKVRERYGVPSSGRSKTLMEYTR
jgi:hypothetical protein